MAGLVASLPQRLPIPEPLPPRVVTAAAIHLPLTGSAAHGSAHRPATATGHTFALSASTAHGACIRTAFTPQAVLGLHSGLTVSAKAQTATGEPLVLSFAVGRTDHQHLEHFFHTPTVDEIQYAGPPRPQIRTRYAVGLSVWRAADGTWHVKYAPTDRDLAGSDRLYRGGYAHHLTDSARAELTAAGFADQIHLEVFR